MFRHIATHVFILPRSSYPIQHSHHPNLDYLLVHLISPKLTSTPHTIPTWTSPNPIPNTIPYDVTHYNMIRTLSAQVTYIRIRINESGSTNHTCVRSRSPHQTPLGLPCLALFYGGFSSPWPAGDVLCYSSQHFTQLTLMEHVQLYYHSHECLYPW